jgi:hypothetical protein
MPTGTTSNMASLISRGKSGAIVRTPKNRNRSNGGSNNRSEATSIAETETLLAERAREAAREAERTGKQKAQDEARKAIQNLRTYRREGSAYISDLRTASRSSRSGESREDYLNRLLKSKVVTPAGKAEAKEELLRLRESRKPAADIKRRLQGFREAQSSRERGRQAVKLVTDRTAGLMEEARKKSTGEKILTFINERNIKSEETRERLIERKREAARALSQPAPVTSGLRGVQAEATRKAQALKEYGIAQGGLVAVTGGRVAGGLTALGTGLVTQPKTTVKAFGKAVIDPKTYSQMLKDLERDPAGAVTEYFLYGKALGATTRVLRRSPLGATIQREIYLLNLPKSVRPKVRTILDATLAQRGIKPFSPKQLENVKIIKPAAMTKTEFKAALKAARVSKGKTVVFGSEAASITSKGRTVTPKDIDLASTNIAAFKQEFIRALPKSERANYVIRGQNIVNKVTGQKVLDIKPYSRLRPNASILGKGYLPVSGYKRTLNLFEKTKKSDVSSQLPFIKKKLIEGAFEIPTEKTIKVKGLQVTGFSEQTTRKALGTIQVLLEKNARRAKDPAALLQALRIQKAALKASKSKNPITVARQASELKKINAAIKLLQSKGFSKLLESKVKGLTTQYPLISKINTAKLRKAVKTATKTKPQDLKLKFIKQPTKTATPKTRKTVKASRLPSSRLPKSVLPSSIPIGKGLKLSYSKLPSKMPKFKRSVLPKAIVSKTPSGLPSSKIPYIKPSVLPSSKLTTSRTPASKIPSSRIPSSKIPSSKTPASKLPASRIPYIKAADKVIPTIKPKFTSVNGRNKGYNLFIKDKGKYKLFAGNVFNKADTTKLGGYVTDNTVTASFQVKPANKNVNTKISQLRYNPKKYRSAKRSKNVKVEKRTFRIDTFGEVRGLKAAKLRKSIGLKTPKKAKKGGFKYQIRGLKL